jgi:hypothetical protein
MLRRRTGGVKLRAANLRILSRTASFRVVEDEVASLRGKRTPHLVIVACLVGGLLFAAMSLAWPLLRHQTETAALSERADKLDLLSKALIEFEILHGSLPSDNLAAEEARFAGLIGSRVLEQLQAEGFVDDLGRLLEVDGAAGGNWLYYPQMGLTGDPGRPVIVAPPVGGRTMIRRLDGSIRLGAPLSEAESTGAVFIPAKAR